MSVRSSGSIASGGAWAVWFGGLLRMPGLTGLSRPPGMEESAWCVGDALAAWGKRGLSGFPWIVWGYQKLAIHWMALTESVVRGIMDSVPVLGAQSIGWAYKAFLALCVMDPDFRVGV